MKLTIVQSVLGGLVDDEHAPLAFVGHLSREQCLEIAVAAGSSYPAMGFVECDEAEVAAFYCNFSNLEDPPRNQDETIERPSQADLELWFYHVEATV